MTQCVVAFSTSASQVVEFVSATCVDWDYVVDLGAGLPIADCAGRLFAQYHPSVFEILRVVVWSAHNALARAVALALGLLTLAMLSTLCLWFVLYKSFCVVVCKA